MMLSPANLYYSFLQFFSCCGQGTVFWAFYAMESRRITAIYYALTVPNCNLLKINNLGLEYFSITVWKKYNFRLLLTKYVGFLTMQDICSYFKKAYKLAHRRKHKAKCFPVLSWEKFRGSLLSFGKDFRCRYPRSSTASNRGQQKLCVSPVWLATHRVRPAGTDELDAWIGLVWVKGGRGQLLLWPGTSTVLAAFKRVVEWNYQPVFCIEI